MKFIWEIWDYFKQQGGQFYAVKPPINDRAIQFLSACTPPGSRSSFKYNIAPQIESSSDYLRCTNYLGESLINPIIILFTGKTYETPLKIECNAQGLLSPSKTPEDVLSLAAIATKTCSTNDYLKLICPTDLGLAAGVGDGSVSDYIQSNIMNANQRFNSNIFITRKVICADNVIFFYKVVAGQSKKEFWIATTKSGDNWYFSSLKGDRTRAALCYFTIRYFGFPITTFPNLFLVQ